MPPPDTATDDPGAPAATAPEVAPDPNGDALDALPEVEVRSTRPASHIITGPLAPTLFKFGLPLVIAMALQATFNLVDMFIIGQLPNSTAALAALAICDMVAMIPTIAGNGIANASVAIIARRDGTGDGQGVALATAQSISVTIIGSVAVGIVGIVFADFITGGIMAAKGEVQILARDYMQIIVGGSFSILLLLQLVAILRAVGDSRTPMLLLVGSNILNLFLSVLMVYGPGEAPEIFSWGPPIAEFFGIARDGVVGAATSTVISRSAAIAIGLVVLAKHSGGLRFPLRHLIPQGAEIRKLMRIAWPNSSQFLLRVGVIIFFMGIISHMFTTAEDSSVLAAFGICVRLDTVALFTGMGWGAAASTFVGQNLGAGQPARAYRAGWISGIYNALMMLLVLVLYLVYAPQIVGFFDSSGGVVAAGTEYLQIVGGSYAFLGIAVVLSQSLSGAGATLSSFVIDAMVLAGLQIPFTILWLIIADVDRMDIWWIIAAGNVVSAFAYAAWYGKKDWLDKKI